MACVRAAGARSGGDACGPACLAAIATSRHDCRAACGVRAEGSPGGRGDATARADVGPGSLSRAWTFRGQARARGGGPVLTKGFLLRATLGI